MTAASPGNVLFILADQWRGDCLSALDHPCVKTPTLDALAADGVLFRRHYCQSVPCGPSRASILTGLYLQNHRSVSNGTPLDARHTNIALEARRAGYDPALIGYTDTSPDPRQLAPDDPALEHYDGVMPGFAPVVHQPFEGGTTPWHAALKAKGYTVPDDPAEIWRPVDSRRGPGRAPPIYTADDSDTAFITDRAIEYLAARGDRPWFLHLCYLRPHPPFVAPEPYNTMYDSAAVPAPRRAATRAREAAQHPLLTHLLTTRDRPGNAAHYGNDGSSAAPSGEHELRQLSATYFGLISEVDANIGRLIDFLKASGRYDNTLIVFGSDHGEQLGDHWLVGKTGYFDQSFHVPLIVRDPLAGAGRGRTVDRFTESVDLMPTVLDWLDLDPPAHLDGHSLLPFCRGESPAGWRAEAHWEVDFRNVRTGAPERVLGIGLDQCALNVIRGERYKYVHFAALPPLFFDLDRDPGELVDRAADPDYAALVLSYAQKLLSWRMEHDERTLTGMHLAPGGVYERR